MRFKHKVAVITAFANGIGQATAEIMAREGAACGSGMGRELVRRLVAEACNVAMCDVSPTGLAETQRLCEAAGLPQGTTHVADVAGRTQVERFRDEVADRHQDPLVSLQFAVPRARTRAGR